MRRGAEAGVEVRDDVGVGRGVRESFVDGAFECVRATFVRFG